MSIITFPIQFGLHVIFFQVNDTKMLLFRLGLESKARGFMEFPLFIVSLFLCNKNQLRTNMQKSLCKLLSIYIMPYDRNMQMTHVIYGYLQRVFLPPPIRSSHPNWHDMYHGDQTHVNRHAHKKGCWPGYYGWVEKT